MLKFEILCILSVKKNLIWKCCFSAGGNSDGEVESDKEDGEGVDKKENSETNNSDGKIKLY